MFSIKTLMNVLSDIFYLLKMNLNLCIGPNSNYNTFYGWKRKSFHFV